MIRSSLVPVAAALLVSAPLAGCGSLDSADLEEELRTQLSADAGVNPDDVTVDCPDDIPAEQGQEFQCELTAPNGDPVDVDVTLTDDEGGFDAVVPPEQFQ